LSSFQESVLFEWFVVRYLVADTRYGATGLDKTVRIPI